MSGAGTILIANRGEIACRIARTAHRLGMSTLGVYSEPDRNSLHVDTVDHAVALGGSTPAESYLRGDLIVEAAVGNGATHLHPGYGFLAENAAFAEQVIAAGITWIGPTPHQIRLLGDKIAAKQAAVEAGVPTTAIVQVDDDRTPVDVQLPALVKAAAGGGGRGMRIVHDADELAAAITSARREAEAAFGDGTVFIEPFIAQGRHVEVQILGDQHGTVVHLGTRECSIQRRNQKIVEEAPSAGIGDAVRDQLHDGAVALAAHVGYEGAGTVEFMVGADDTITFLEVNTRLQVEHPVTESITGIDLVAAQIDVANGNALPFSQGDIEFDGHAIEVRLVAEDPSEGWLPSTGTLSAFEIDGDIRVDSGFRPGDAISSDYDSLLAKVIAHAPTRRTAASVLGRTLQRACVGGVRTNAAMLAATLSEPDFLDASTFTNYLDNHPGVAAAAGPVDDDRLALLLGAIFADELRARSDDALTAFAPSGWRNLRTRGQRRIWLLGSDEFQVEYTVSDGARASDADTGPKEATNDIRVDIAFGPWPEPIDDGTLGPDERRRATCRVLSRSDAQVDRRASEHRADPVTEIVVELDGRRTAVTVRSHGDTVITSSTAGTLEWTRPPRFIDHDATTDSGGPICPLPGTVIAVHVAEGDAVVDGQLLMVVEAMKMEHKIVASGTATVDEVRFAVGDRVDGGDLLVALSADPPAAES